MTEAASRAPVCLGCAWDRYKDQYDTTMVLNREWPTTPKTCHLCGMTTEMGYSVEVGLHAYTHEDAAVSRPKPGVYCLRCDGPLIKCDGRWKHDGDQDCEECPDCLPTPCRCDPPDALRIHDAAGPCWPRCHRGMPDGSRCRCGLLTT